MKESITRRAKSGAGVILSSHLLHLVEELCTRLLVMQRGRAIAIGELLHQRLDDHGGLEQHQLGDRLGRSETATGAADEQDPGQASSRQGSV